MAVTSGTIDRPIPGGLAPRFVAEALFTGADIRHVEGYEAIADLYDGLPDQRPATCGAYAPRYLLGPLGFERHEGIDTAREDYLAFLAGTVIEAFEVEPSQATRAEVARKGLSEEHALKLFPDTYYRWPLRSSDDPVVAGTSPTGTARAISLASGGSLATLPVPARAADRTILMTPERFMDLFELLSERLADWRIHPIANYQVDRLPDPTSDAYLAAALMSRDPEAAIPREHWGVGHFAGIGALWRAADGRAWFLLLDSYKARGFRGYEPQPAEALRRGLVRDDGRDGGLLLVMPRDRLAPARAAIEELGMEVRMWGNGSLEPEGWSWEFGR